jgi:hypothetical protein
LAALSPEELQALDMLTKKLALPAPDGPQEQEPIDVAALSIDGDVTAATDATGSK